MSYISEEVRSQVRRDCRDRCSYCQALQQYILGVLEIDHIIPKVDGGSDEAENLCLACPSCNRFKAVRKNTIDPITEISTPFFNPQLQIWEEHFAWNEDASEIVGLTDIGRVTIEALKMNRVQLIRVRKMWVKLGEHPPKLR